MHQDSPTSSTITWLCLHLPTMHLRNHVAEEWDGKHPPRPAEWLDAQHAVGLMSLPKDVHEHAMQDEQRDDERLALQRAQ